MLTAYKENGEKISLIEPWDKTILERLRKETTFYCPSCKLNVQLKLGNHKKWHFSHLANSNCYAESEGESLYHIQGKKLLYVWLKRQGIKTALEPFIRSIMQRPDLLIQNLRYYYPLEFQCAAISATLFQKRTHAFQTLQLDPLWILGGNRLRRKTYTIFKLHEMDWLSLRIPQHSSSPTLLYFCPETKYFAVLSAILPISSSSIFAKIQYIPLMSITIKTLLYGDDSASFSVDVPEWLEQKKKWRFSALRNHTPVYQYVRKVSQSSRIPLSYFPSLAGLPGRQLFWLKTPCFLWQTWILLHFLHPLPLHSTFSLQQLLYYFKRMIHKKIFVCRQLPLINHGNYTDAVKEYLTLLIQCGLLTEKRHAFQKVRPVPIPSSIEDALLQDQQVIKTIKF
jgi:competence protein CoiA